MSRVLVCICVFITFITACKPPPAEDTLLEQSLREEKKILAYIATNKLVATRHYSGMYFIITDPGATEIIPYYETTNITAKYTGRLLDGPVFSNVVNPSSNPLSSLILGWQMGIPLIRKGGKIRLFVPSAMAYGQNGMNPIPPNAILDFEIELINVQN